MSDQDKDQFEDDITLTPIDELASENESSSLEEEDDSEPSLSEDFGSGLDDDDMQSSVSEPTFTDIQAPDSGLTDEPSENDFDDSTEPSFSTENSQLNSYDATANSIHQTGQDVTNSNLELNILGDDFSSEEEVLENHDFERNFDDVSESKAHEIEPPDFEDSTIEHSEPSIKPRQTNSDFSELRKSVESETAEATTTDLSIPFSVLVKGIRYDEDAKTLLRAIERHDYGIDRKQAEAQIKRGSVLIPRISEYMAMHLAKDIKLIDADIFVGPSDELFASPKPQPTELTKKPSRGKKEGFQLKERAQSAKDIIVSTTSDLPGQKIGSFLGLVSVTVSVPESMEPEEAIEKLEQTLTDSLREKAFLKGAHAILGTQINLSQSSSGYRSKFRITATATAVALQRNS